MVDAFSRHAIRVSVAQICQVIGWTSIQSSPLEILTDILQEYITGLAKVAGKYAMLFGQCEPNLNHVALAFKDMGISIAELEEYVTYVETGCVLEVPKYPIPKESHLNHLKPGSREVVTRPVHIHEHLPPMHPHLEDQDYGITKSPLTVEVSSTDTHSPLSSPKGLFKKPGDPVSSDPRRARQAHDDEVRPLREISSVMMTTSGFLSPAREGKLPEARTQPVDFSQSALSPEEEEPSPADQSNETTITATTPTTTTTTTTTTITKTEKKKKSKSVEVSKKPEKESKLKDDQPGEQKETEEESKGKKLVNTKETSKLKASKTVAMKIPSKPPSPSPPPLKKAKLQLSPSSQLNAKPNKIKSPKTDKRPLSPLIKDLIMPVPPKDTSVDDVKLPSEPDRQKLNILKKISKVKEDFDDSKVIAPENRETSAPNQDSSLVAQQRKSVPDNTTKNIDEDMEVHIDVENNSPPVTVEQSQTFSPGVKSASPTVVVESIQPPSPKVDKAADLPKTPEVKKKKKDKQKEKKTLHEIDKGSPKNKYQGDESFGKMKELSVTDVFPTENPMPTTYHVYSVATPPAPGLMNPWSQPLASQNASTTKNLPALPSISNNTNIMSSMKSQEEAPLTGQQIDISTSSSSNALSSSLPLTSFTNKDNNLILMKKKERKRDKKLKDKLKKKKDKKDKSKIKDKSERKKLKLQKKEKAKLRQKKEKKEKKKDKEGFGTRIFEHGHIAEDVLNTLQPWASDSGPPKKIKVEDKEESANQVPKITFKLGPPSPKDVNDSCLRKIVIKPIVKKDEDNADPSPPVSQEAPKTPITIQKIKTHKGAKLNQPPKIDVPDKGPSFVLPQFATPKMDSFPVVPKWEADPNKVWICPACARPDDGSPMIACDSCDLWFHWTCVGIQEAIESDWYCTKCIAKRDDGHGEKKKKHRKKKS